MYNYHRLLSWDEDRGLHMDIYKVTKVKIMNIQQIVSRDMEANCSWAQTIQISLHNSLQGATPCMATYQHILSHVCTCQHITRHKEKVVWCISVPSPAQAESCQTSAQQRCQNITWRTLSRKTLDSLDLFKNPYLMNSLFNRVANCWFFITTHSQMFQKVEYGWGPIFKVVLEC